MKRVDEGGAHHSETFLFILVKLQWSLHLINGESINGELSEASPCISSSNTIRQD